MVVEQNLLKRKKITPIDVVNMIKNLSIKDFTSEEIGSLKRCVKDFDPKAVIFLLNFIQFFDLN